MLIKILFSARLIFQILLLTMFLIFFGVPYVQKYLEMNVMVVKNKRHTGGIEAPAITIVARHPNTKQGWTNGQKITNNNKQVEGHCGETSNIGKCISQKTYDQVDAIKAVTIGFDKQEPQMDPKLWTEDFTTARLADHIPLAFLGK